MEPLVEKQHIEMTPDTCGGRPRIAGTRIRVQDVVIWHLRMGMSADEIVEHYSHLTRADVHAALTFYWDHKDAIDRQMAEDEAWFEELRRTHPSLLDKVAKKLADQDERPNPVPS